MEKKQLNFNAPLISVRRMSSIVAQPEEVIRKTIGKSLPNRQQSLPIPKAKRDVVAVPKPASVPFVWEQSPGQRKPGNERKSYAHEEASATPKLPPGRARDSIRFYSGERPRGQTEALSWNDHAALLDSLVDSMYSEVDDDARSGSYGSLSPSESLPLSCSVSGLSGYQAPDVKPSGTFSVDLQTRDFMMNRFIPAAKAVVLETPQYVPKKELRVPEEPKAVVKKTGPPERKAIKKYEPHNVQCYSDYTSESDDEVVENLSAKKLKKSGRSWKIFPRLCVKNALCLLNPLPGMKARSQTPAPARPPPAKDVKRLARNAFSGPLNMPRKAYSGPLDKQVCDAMYNRRFHSGALSGELCNDRRISSRLSYSTDLHRSDGLSPRRHSRSGAISPYRNVTPRSPFNEGAKFLGVPREVEKSSRSLQDTPRSSIPDVPSDSQGDDVHEKTVYVDSVTKVGIPKGIIVSDENVEKKRSVEENQFSNDDEKKNNTCDVTSSNSLLPPPLPRTPSESWLWRTLPSAPLQNPKKQRSKATKTAATKWETIVKSSYLHHDHARYSEELFPQSLRQRKRVQK